MHMFNTFTPVTFNLLDGTECRRVQGKGQGISLDNGGHQGKLARVLSRASAVPKSNFLSKKVNSNFVIPTII